MRNWTEEERQKQRDLIRAHKPWLHSTGPRTEEGKAAISQNALKHGMRTAGMDNLRRVLRDQRRCIRSIMAGLPPLPPPPEISEQTDKEA